ncbi:hypothetical protein HK098_004102 [Nowakowskiella sp. JEL0407]|nr:hypothetical protein HK098_004102 [Nowakowskiella sp. JEL0407]
MSNRYNNEQQEHYSSFYNSQNSHNSPQQRPPALDGKRVNNPRQLQRQSSQFTTFSLPRQPFRPAPEREGEPASEIGRKIFMNPTDPQHKHKNLNFDVPDWRYLINEFLIPGGGVLQFVLFPLWILNCLLVAIPGIMRWRARSGKFIDNSIRTSRYNLLDFIPKQLLFQFSKIANLYFLTISMLQLVDGWSPTGKFTTIFPLAAFVVVAMLREGLDDLARHRADAKENNQSVTRLSVERHGRRGSNAGRVQNSSQEMDYLNHVHRLPLIDNASAQNSRDALRFERSMSDSAPVSLPPKEYQINAAFQLSDGVTSARWENVKCRNLHVGDLILIRNNEMIPADVVVLASTNPNGICYIETANLDGETNLKQKQAVKATFDIISNVQALASFFGIIQTESPTDNLYGFDGYLEVGHRGTGERIPLTPNQLLLRGATLRNTHHVFGVVVYTGEDTKIRMNANTPTTKASTMEKLTNKIVLLVFGFVLLLAGVLTVGAAFWELNVLRDRHLYIAPTPFQVDYAAIFFSFVILFNTMVPISLYVTMEVVKLLQTQFINWDRGMYDPVTDTPAQARTSSLNEELGQVQYIFSDKTGTLTENLMVFRKLSVAGLPYFHNSKKHPPPSADSSVQSTDVLHPVDQLLSSLRSYLSSSNSQDPIYDLTVSPKLTSQQLYIEKSFRFLEAMALCHTIVPDRTKLEKFKEAQRYSDVSINSDAIQTDDMIIYQSSSPDEVALSDAAREMFFTVRDKDTNYVKVSIFNRLTSYQILQTLEFNSTRKRMSVIYRFPEGRVILLCKGADSIILERLRDINTLPRYEAEFLEKTNTHLRDFALEGLRTLLYAYRVLDEAEYQRWSARYAEASTALEGRAKKLEDVAAEIECDLVLLGATAIEDKLQEGVPETIDALRKAGVKIWMLTGDKKETAVNIGHTCQITKDWSEVLFIEGKNVGEIARSLEESVVRAANVQTNNLQRWDSKDFGGSNSTISGDLGRPAKGPLSKSAEGKQPHVVLVCEGETLLKMEEQHVKYLDSIGGKNPKAEPKFSGRRADKRWDHEQPHGTEPPVVDPLGGAPRDYSVLLRFLDLGIRCDSVICCRFSPAQKALIVSEVKNRVLADDDRLSQDVARKPRHGMKTGASALLLDGTGTKHVQRSMLGQFFRSISRSSFPSCVTLAIGDGANDIPMIQAAHVGIGIAGREGLAAARSSDYSVAQFRFLQPLLLVHGRWNYVRISLFTLGTFYKCIAFYSTQAMYQVWTGFSGATLYEPWTLSLYNIFFSSFPVLAVGIFERDLSRSTLLAVPELYKYGQLCHGFNFVVFLKWMSIGLWHAVSTLAIPFILYNALRSPNLREPSGGLTTKTLSNPLSFSALFYGDMNGSKEEEFTFALGTQSYAIMVLIISIKIAYMDSRYVTLYHHLSVLLTALLWFAYNEIYPRLWPHFGVFGMETSGMQSLFRGYYWLIYIPVVILGGFIGIGLLDFTVKSFTALWSPSNPIQSSKNKLDDPAVTDSDARAVAKYVQTLHLKEQQAGDDFEIGSTDTAYMVALNAAVDAANWWNKNGPPTSWEWASTNAVRWWQVWEYAFGIPPDLDFSLTPDSAPSNIRSSPSSSFKSTKMYQNSPSASFKSDVNIQHVRKEDDMLKTQHSGSLLGHDQRKAERHYAPSPPIQQAKYSGR